MKNALLLPTLAFVGLTVSGAMAHPHNGNPWSHIHGTSILHWAFRAVLEPVGDPPDPAPAGWVAGKRNQQGNADHQYVTLAAVHLQPNTPYRIKVLLGDATEPVTVAEVETNWRGWLVVANKKLKFSNHGEVPQPDKFRLPPELDPITAMREVTVTTTNDEVVLRADITEAYALQYLVRRNLDNDGTDDDAMGALYLRANHRHGWYVIHASGLDADTDYSLVINGDVTETVTTDARGNLVIIRVKGDPHEVWTLQSLAIEDGDGNSVLSTVLP